MHDVEHDRVGPLLLHEAEAIVAVLGDQDVVALELERRAQGLPDGRLVLHDEHATGHGLMIAPLVLSTLRTSSALSSTALRLLLGSAAVMGP